MLSTNRRIKKDSFNKIIKEGLFLCSNNFNLRLLDRKEDLPTLFAFVVPAKVKKTSVGRHLIKRRISAVVEKLLINLKPSFFVLLFVKKDISSFSSKTINIEIIELFKKAKILNEDSI
jgi:ribonuclease P protein component